MAPIAGIFVLIWAVRAISGNSNSGGNSTARQQKEVSPAILGVFIKIVFFGIALAIADESATATAIIRLIAMPICLPRLFLSLVVCPLGMHRLAYWWVRFTWPLGMDARNRTGAVLYGAVALAAKGPTHEKIDWLARRIPEISRPPFIAEMATALLNALDGKRETARAMFHAIDVHPLSPGDRKWRRIARDWLVTDAARRGDWDEVILRGRRGRRSYRWSYAVARIAERIDGRPDAFRDWQLKALWILAPRRRRLLPLLRQALLVPRVIEREIATLPVPEDLHCALSDLAGLLGRLHHGRRPPEPEEFLSMIRWCGVRLDSPATHAEIETRLRVLDPLRADSAGAVIAQFREQLIALVLPLVETWPHLVEDESECPIIRQAIERIQAAVFQDIEARCRDYATRAANKVSLDMSAEWESWAKLKGAADRLLIMNPSTEDTIFREVYVPICNFAAYQHNSAVRYGLAYDMFSWLHEHAGSNVAAIELLAKNMEASSRQK